MRRWLFTLWAIDELAIAIYVTLLAPATDTRTPDDQIAWFNKGHLHYITPLRLRVLYGASIVSFATTFWIVLLILRSRHR